MMGGGPFDLRASGLMISVIPSLRLGPRCVRLLTTAC